MKPFRDPRHVSMFVGGIALLSIVLLTAGMGQLELKPAIPFAPAGGEGQAEEPLASRPPDILFWYLTLIVIGILAVGTIVALFLSPPKQRRRLVMNLLMMAFLLVVAALIISRQDEGFEFVAEQPPVSTEAPPEIPTLVAVEEVPPSEFVAPPVSPWISFVVAFALFTAVVFVLWLALRRREPGEQAHFAELQQIAQRALEDLQSGRDYGDTVIECYAHMTEAVRQRRGIKRREHMTAGEFAAALERARLPGEAVRRLTRLFEAVRYGGRKSTPQDVEEARACLTAIIEGCQEAR